MVQALVQNHLVLRGDTYYFRYVLPAYIRVLCPTLPSEIKRSLRTDSYTLALNLSRNKLPLIKKLQKTRHVPSIQKLFQSIANFPELINLEQIDFKGGEAIIPTLSEAWSKFTEWKTWTDKQAKANQRIFNNLIYFIGDIPVEEITKSDIKVALNFIAELPQRNKKNYKRIPLEKLIHMDIPQEDVVSGKYVKEHLKICQSLFSRYLKDEVDILSVSPTDGLRYDYKDNRYAALNDAQVRTVLSTTQNKPDWFKWFIHLAVYSGARRAELLGLLKSDFKYCTDSNRYYLHIRQGKTKAATRLVPLHFKLIDNGILDWLASRDEGAVFTITPNRVTDLFNSLFDKRVNYLGERIVLHSIRHTFITKVRAAGISNALVQQVVGHEKSGAGQTDRYTHTFHLKDVLIVVDAIDFYR